MKYILITILLLAGCSINQSNNTIPLLKLGQTAIEQEIEANPALALKTDKENIIESREITIYVDGEMGTSTVERIPKTVMSYDYVSEEKMNGEFIYFNNSRYSNVRVFDENTRDYISGDIVYKDDKGENKRIITGATTSVEAFIELTKISRLDKIKRFFGKKVIASDDYTSTIGDALLARGINANWTTARGLTTASGLLAPPENSTGSYFMLFQLGGDSNYVISRCDWKFNTAGIDDGDTLSDVVLHVNINDGTSSNNDTETIHLVDNTSQGAALNHPLQTEDYNDFDDTPIGSETYADLITDGASATIDLTDFTVINKTGNSYVGIMTDGDINNNTPTGTNNLFMKTGTAGFDPFLRITAIPPVVIPPPTIYWK